MNTIANHVVPGTLGRTPVTNPLEQNVYKKKRVKRTQSKSNLHHRLEEARVNNKTKGKRKKIIKIPQNFHALEMNTLCQPHRPRNSGYDTGDHFAKHTTGAV